MQTETTTTKATFSTEQLDTALLGAPHRGIEGCFEVFDRSAIGDKLILLKDTAYQVKNSLFLEGDHIDVGIEKRYLTPQAISTIKEFGHVEDPTEDFVLTIDSVPVNVKVITRHYPWFKDLNSLIYKYEIVYLPNPFENYWKARFIIQ
jgi:hypothetical protein